jgi:hypothetical protein
MFMANVSLAGASTAAWPLLLHKEELVYWGGSRELDGKFLVTRDPIPHPDEPANRRRSRHGILAELTAEQVAAMWEWPWWSFYDPRIHHEKPMVETRQLDDILDHMFDKPPALVRSLRVATSAEAARADRAKAPAWVLEAADNGYTVAYRFADGDIMRQRTT